MIVTRSTYQNKFIVGKETELETKIQQVCYVADQNAKLVRSADHQQPVNYQRCGFACVSSDCVPV